MSHTSKIFNKVPVKVQKRSGFDLSHENLFTATVGTLIPASVEEVMPGDVVSIGSAMAVELPPLATNFKGRVDARLEAFFVPNRLLWAGWQNFITQDPNSTPVVPGYSVAASIPKVTVPQTRTVAGSLADYLGVKGSKTGTEVSGDFNALPFLAYHKIWDDWYRDSNIQQPFFVDGVGTGSFGGINAAILPYQRITGTLSVEGVWSQNGSVKGYNGKDLRDLNQRNFSKDYFTTMTTQPQSGAAAELEFELDLQGETGSFTIASLRAANALQKWLERNNIAGTRYFDQILAHYGVLPSDAVFQRSVLLGAETVPVIVNSISQQAQGTNSQSRNPYANSTGAQFGKGTAFGKGRLVNNFEVKEHGYIFILFSLVPHAYYSTGTRRYITQRNGSSTFAFPEFAGIGDQPVKKSELYSPFFGSANDTTIGYNQRYSEYKYHDDEVHGLLSDGNSLASFVLQRGFDSSVGLNGDLLAIPTSYMNDVMITTAGVSGFNCLVDCYFDAKYLRVLPEYSLPTLCSNEDGGGKTVMVNKGGTRL